MRTYPWRRRLLMLAAPALLFASASHAEPSHEESAKPEHSNAASVLPGTPSVSPRDTAVEPHASRRSVGKLDVRSSSVLVMDEVDSSVLYSKHPNRVVPVASITKLMTALVVLESEQPLDELIEIAQTDRDCTKGSASRLAVGTQLTRGDLLHLALMSSENRAAQAVARAHPGGVKAFVRAMNAKARALGMKNARFVDPTGLSNQNVSSAADLTKLVIAASRDPVIQKFSTHQSYAVSVGKRLLEFRNTNTLVSKPDWDIRVQKTGYTQDAGQCLVMKTLIQDRPVVIVLLNSFGKYTRVADARRIRKWMEAASQSPQLAGIGQ